jgi:hypothetical protein
MGLNRFVVFNGGVREASPQLQWTIAQLIQDAKTPQLYNMMSIWMNLSRLEEVCRWLIKNNLKGWRLHNWLINECQNSPLEAARFVLSKLNKNKDQKVFFGSDWLA